MEKKINLLGVFALLTLLTAGTASAEIPNGFPNVFDWQTDYIQYRDTGDTGGKYGKTCHMYAHIEGELTGGFCSGFPDMYGFTVDTLHISTACDVENILANGRFATSSQNAAPYLMLFMDDGDATDETGILGMETNSDRGLKITCAANNLTCEITDPAPAIVLCINGTAYNSASAEDKKLKMAITTFWVNKITPTADMSSASGLWNISINIPPSDIEAFTDLEASEIFGTRNTTGVLPYDQRGANVRSNYVYFVQGGEDYLADINILGFTRNLMVNITDEPLGLDLSEGEFGLWYCSDPSYYPQSRTSSAYTTMKAHCANLLQTSPLYQNLTLKLDSDGNRNFYDVNSQTCASPLAVYWYSQGSYTDVMLTAIVSLAENDDPIEVEMLWSGVNERIQHCVELWDDFNGYDVTPDTIKLAFYSGTFLGPWSTFDNSTYALPNGFCFDGNNGVSYEILMKKQGYDSVQHKDTLNANQYYYLGITPLKNETRLNSYNLTGIILGRSVCPGGTTEELEGATVYSRCYLGNEQYQALNSRRTDSSGVFEFLNYAPSGVYCEFWATASGYDSSTKREYMVSGNYARNITLIMRECDDDTGNTSIQRTREVEFRVFQLSGMPLENAQVRVSSQDCGVSRPGTSTGLTTNGQGSVSFSNLPDCSDYVYEIWKLGYEPITKSVMQDGGWRSYIEETLKTESENGGFINVYVEQNGSKRSNARVEMWFNGVKTGDGITDVNGNLLEMDCTAGKTYVLKAFWGVYSGDTTVKCNAEGVNAKITLSNAPTRADEIGGEIGNLAYDTLWPIIQLILVIIAFKVLLDVLGKW